MCPEGSRTVRWQWPRMVVRLSALSTGRFYPQEILLVFISVRGWVEPRAIVRSEGLYQWRILMTPSVIETATFRFVAQHFNHCAIAVSLDYRQCWAKCCVVLLHVLEHPVFVGKGKGDPSGNHSVYRNSLQSMVHWCQTLKAIVCLTTNHVIDCL